MTQFSRPAYLGIIIVTVSLTPWLMATRSSAQDLKQLAEELFQLRSKVQEVQDKIDSQNEQHQSKMHALNVQRSDLAALIQREEIQTRQVKEQITLLTSEEALYDQKLESELRLILANELEQTRLYIQNSLPFRPEERLKAVDEIIQSLQANNRPVFPLINQFWGLLENELRLHQDFGIYRNSVLIGDEEQFIEVIRVGMMGFYYKSADNKYGLVLQKNGKPEHLSLNDTRSKRAIDNLYHSLRRQIRSGKFALPGLLEAELI